MTTAVLKCSVVLIELQKPYGCCSHSNIPLLRLVETQEY